MERLDHTYKNNYGMVKVRHFSTSNIDHPYPPGIADVALFNPLFPKLDCTS